MEQLQEITGTVSYILYKSPETDYMAFDLELPDGESTKVAGRYADLRKGQNVRVFGNYQNHKKYGWQFKAAVIDQPLPHTVDGVYRYLVHNFSDVGHATASKIVKAYGADLVAAFEGENAVERLVAIGIRKKRAIRMCEQYRASTLTMEDKLFFADLMLGPSQIAAIQKQLGANARDIITKNPYCLITRVKDFGFRRADAVAERLGIAKNDENRLKAGVIYTLEQSVRDGQVFLTQAECVREAVKILGVRDEDIGKTFMALNEEAQVVLEDNRVYLPSCYYAEVGVASWFEKAIDRAPILNGPGMEKKVRKAISEIEKAKGRTLDESQREAVINAIQHPVMVITGGPGTGKTTTLDIILTYLTQRRRYSVALCAPTGRAAKRMSEQTGLPASTIHRLIGAIGRGDDERQETATETVEADVVVVDEMSMVDISLMNMLLRSLEPETKLILIGDIDQLPSIGPGSVLKDIIEAGVCPVARLKYVHRQADGGSIIESAHQINEGVVPKLDMSNNEFVFTRRSSAEKALDVLTELVTTRIPAYFDIAPSDVQVLSPKKSGLVGVNNINAALQARENPASPDKDEMTVGDVLFRTGDKVINIRNNYGMEWTAGHEKGLGVLNGDTGFITHINTESREVTISFDDGRVAVYDTEDMRDLLLAYALTVHKSQGSEYPVVVIPCLEKYPPMLCNRSLLYTAVTRAKKAVVLIGTEDCVQAMVNNNYTKHRNTTLKDRLLARIDLRQAQRGICSGIS